MLLSARGVFFLNWIILLLSFQTSCFSSLVCHKEGPPFYYFDAKKCVNFGDYLSLKLVERIVDSHLTTYKKLVHKKTKKLLAIGSILIMAGENDVVWGSGINGKDLDRKLYHFENLDVRSVRGPLTRQYLKEVLAIECPEIYGDPALLVPYFFPEFQKKANPQFDYIVIPHYSEEHLFPKDLFPNVVYATEPWHTVIEKITNSKFVISSSLHGVIVAEAFGIPARLLRITENEPLFKYFDYYYGTQRHDFVYANTIEEALALGGEKPFKCDLLKLYEAFPFELWENLTPKMPFLMDPLSTN